MITVINGTNRSGNTTHIFSQFYGFLLEEMHVDFKYVSLEQLPANVFTPDSYAEKPPALIAFEQEYLYPADKFIIVFPEYNGSFPGILKTLIDYSDIKKAWTGKKVALTGVSDGRAGNLRGIDQMTTFFHYMKANIYPHYLPISSIKNILDETRQNIISEATKKDIRKQVEGFIHF